MAFSSNVNGTVQLDARLVTLYQDYFIKSVQSWIDQNILLGPVKFEAMAKTFSFVKYTSTTPVTSGSVELNDITPTAIVDTPITLTPTEYDLLVTRTKLDFLQSGGAILDAAIMSLVEQNMQVTLGTLALTAMAAGTNINYPGNQVADSTIAATDVLTADMVFYLKNRLARAGVPRWSDGLYRLVIHEDQFYDLSREIKDLGKYTPAGYQQIANNDIGSFGGFRIFVVGNYSTSTSPILTVDVGSNSKVDVYKACAFGPNSLGLGVSQMPNFWAKDAPAQVPNRFVNVGWSGVLQYGIIDTDHLQIADTASSIGINT